MAIEGTFTFYNADNQIVSLSAQSDSVFSIAIDCPETLADGIAQAPSINQIPVITITKDDLNALASVRYFVFQAALGKNTTAVTLTSDAALRIHMSIAADADLILDLEEII